ncbi:hypothetical protein Q5Y75_22645 [Ruegeria sp. 2205SS24-7]|uniref:hypothetical protein n=1 Tax=Ruegeria discodermiae TaxID=3064389 RepID=UPI002741A36B|nr:hypothetical protein [Ruegeria sp. 2205SS24-7]MDP5220013.1 hypothetical protein [Ruegeria sp. 2205SS24-7]
MQVIADILLAAGAFGAGFYCFILSRRLKRFSDLEKGVGGAVAVLSAQVEDLTKIVDTARAAAGSSGAELQELTRKSESVAHRLELLIASFQDVAPAEEAPVQAPAPSPSPKTNKTPAPGLMFQRTAQGVEEAAS